MAANSGSENETYHEVPASQYWYLGDTIGAVPKAFFKYFTLSVIIFDTAATAIACLTDWWQRLGIALGTWLYITNPMIGFPATILTLGVGYFFYHRKQKHKHKNVGVKN